MTHKLLDLFCGAGGAAMGYHTAGFDVTGVDNKPQPHYPFRFVLADAMEYLVEHGQEYDIIHASPPCQGYSVIRNLPWNPHKSYPLLLLPLIEILENLQRPYVVENVMGARHRAKGLAKRGLEAHGLKAGWLCGLMFGRPYYRHRLFATNWPWLAPGHPKHKYQISSGNSIGGSVFPTPNPKPKRWVYGGDRRGLPGAMVGLNLTSFTGAVGHIKGWREAAEAMGIDWMKRDELTQAIPPVYTGFIGQCFLRLPSQATTNEKLNPFRT